MHGRIYSMYLVLLSQYKRKESISQSSARSIIRAFIRVRDQGKVKEMYMHVKTCDGTCEIGPSGGMMNGM